jgi:hypothetical protein
VLCFEVILWRYELCATGELHEVAAGQECARPAGSNQRATGARVEPDVSASYRPAGARQVVYRKSDVLILEMGLAPY